MFFFDTNVIAIFREAEESRKRLALKLLGDERKLRTAGSVLHGVRVV